MAVKPGFFQQPRLSMQPEPYYNPQTGNGGGCITVGDDPKVKVCAGGNTRGSGEVAVSLPCAIL